MKRFIYQLIKDQSCSLGIKIFLGLLLLTFIFLLFTFSLLPPQVPLFYSRPWGEEQLGSSIFLWILPGGALLFSLLNLIMAVFLFEEFPLLVRFLVWSNVFISLLSGIAVFKIVTLIV